MEGKCQNETLRVRGMNLYVHFAHARRHISEGKCQNETLRMRGMNLYMHFAHARRHILEGKCQNETLRMRGMNLYVHFAHARRHILALRGPFSDLMKTMFRFCGLSCFYFFFSILFCYIQSNFNGSNIFGTIENCSRYG